MPFYFKNPGVLPLEAITTLGISVKDEGSIGRFGTGLKYTIAGVLRLGEEISIETGGKTYYFFKKPVVVKGKEFSLVCMREISGDLTSERDLGFTTDLGKHWEPWMFIRELWSNMKDEGGSHGMLNTAQLEPISEDETRIICAGAVLDAVYRQMDSYILPENLTPIFEGPRVQLFPKIMSTDPDTIFFQGIAVGKLDHRFPYRVNLKHADLTEDRIITSPYVAGAQVMYDIMESDNTSLIRGWLTEQREEYLPARIGLNFMSDKAKSILKDLWDKSPHLLNATAQSEASALFKPDDSAIEFELSQDEREMFEKGLNLIKAVGEDFEVEWKFVKPLDDDRTYGFVRDDTAYICKSAFDNGAVFVAQTMYEEYLHLTYGFKDYSHALQEHLFRKVISLAQEIHGKL